MLEDVNFDEAKQSQLPAIEILLALGYKYISIVEVLRQRGGDTSNFILTEIASKKLMEINLYEVDGKRYKFSEKDVRDAIDELEHIPYEGLIDTAKNVYNTVMPTAGGKTIRVSVDGKTVSKNFRFIDFAHPERNDFHVTVEYKASGKQNIRPDIVCFVNGIPFAVIENKKSGVSYLDAIHQMIRNQSAEFCPKLFTYTQLLVGTNGQKFMYGTTGAQAEFYALWREKGLLGESDTIAEQRLTEKTKALIGSHIDMSSYAQILQDLNGFVAGHTQRTDRIPTQQDRGIAALFDPVRLLDLTKNYIIFDGGVKKISRYPQYFSIYKMLERVSEIETIEQKITRRKGGLVWHTQGTGKSLTMVMFVKALIEHPHIAHPRVIIVTDRRDLDRQIKDTFKNCNLKKDVIQASSGQNLLNLVREKNLAIITTLIDKFESASKKKSSFVDTDKNIFVLIDEAHRSQRGKANFEMNQIIPNACYIGFTGTPLMRKDKESWRKFGGYIDKYTIDDALADDVILPLIYEGRYVDLTQNEEQIDRRVDRVSEDISVKYNVTVDEQYKRQMQQQITAEVIRNNPQRIEEIAHDIEEHYMKHFQHTGLKAQVVAPSKYSAVLFQRHFEKSGAIRTAMVISDEHEDGDVTDAHKRMVLEYLAHIRSNHQSITKYEKDVIDSFKYQEDGVEVIIVVDKLLTGFDAPRNTVLYLAKDLKDHNLLQAIARVNRLFENKKLPKTAGYIIDYSENAKNIDSAMKLFGSYEKDDVEGTLIDVKEKVYELEESYSALQDVFKEIKASTDDEVYIQFLQDKPTRDEFYEALRTFIATLNECYVLQDFVHEFRHLDTYIRDLKKFMELRKTVSLQYADRIDLSEYKQSLVNILDKYIDARGVELLTKQVNITDRKQFEEAVEALGTDKSKAEAIAAQTQRTITEKMDTDPIFYTRFSEKISEILGKMKAGKLADIEALKQLKMIEDNVVNKKDNRLPRLIEKHPGADIFYRNLREEFDSRQLPEDVFIGIVLEIFLRIKNKAIVDWHKNSDVQRQIVNAIDDFLYDEVIKKMGISLTGEQMKRIIEKVMTLAEHNYEVFR